MSTINDSGPAYPVQDAVTWQAHGMTLRDYFAAKAMQAFCSGPDGGLSPGPNDTNWMTATARVSYELADAMLKARGQQ